MSEPAFFQHIDEEATATYSREVLRALRNSGKTKFDDLSDGMTDLLFEIQCQLFTDAKDLQHLLAAGIGRAETRQGMRAAYEQLKPELTDEMKGLLLAIMGATRYAEQLREKETSAAGPA